MSAVIAVGAAEDRYEGEGPGATARDRAVWLAELATWRQGVVGFLVARWGGLDETLDRSPHEIAAAVRGRARSRGGKGGETRKGGEARKGGGAGTGGGAAASAGGREGRGEAEADDGLFAALLARGPQPGAAARPDIVTWRDPSYPPQLRDLPDPPPALFLGGNAAEGLRALAERHVVAVVGSRSPSAYGREMARAIARDLSAAGVLVVSGLALGIDAVAHEAALDAATGRAANAASTVAVLGCGADVEHPPSNRRLFARVRAQGLLVSEFSWGVGARPWRFPARNRVMAGLCEAVVAVEGAERSGALITARHALDLGREVLAVPGEAGRRLSAGPHRLLREGAALCESARDVLEVLGCGELALGWRGRTLAGGERSEGDTPGDGGSDAQADPSSGAGPPADPGQRADRLLIGALDEGVQTVDHLAAIAGLDVAATLARLALLEVDGAVEACGGGAYRLRRGS